MTRPKQSMIRGGQGSAWRYPVLPGENVLDHSPLQESHSFVSARKSGGGGESRLASFKAFCKGDSLAPGQHFSTMSRVGLPQLA